jgi:hypothetical protein
MPVKTQSEARRQISVYELSETPAFKCLSPKQAIWILTYCQHYLDTGELDPLGATKAAYECAKEEYARTFAYQLLSHPKIVVCLNRFFGETPERSFLDQVERACLNKKLTVAQVDALKLYGELRGWTGRRKRSKADDEPETDSPSIDAGTFGAPAQKVPEDALEVWSDPKTGALIGYRDRSGEAIKL